MDYLTERNQTSRIEILLVDDGRILPSLFSPALKEKYGFTQAETPSEALYFLYTGMECHCLIVDAGLDRSAAYRLMEEIHGNDRFSGIYKILLLDRMTEEDQKKMLELSVDRCLTRPYFGYLTGEIIDAAIEKEVRGGRQTEQRMKGLLTQLDAIKEGFHGGITLFDAEDNMKLVDCNTEFADMLGYEVADLKTFNLNLLNRYIHEEDCGIVIEGLYNGINQNRFYELKIRLLCKDGTALWVRVSADKCIIEKHEYVMAFWLPMGDDNEELDILKNRVSQLENQSNVDSLTRIYGRDRFCLEVEKLRADDPHVKRVIIVYDIDNFSNVNEFHGTVVGDRLLQAVAGLISVSDIGYETWGRIGGDWFAVCMTYDTFIRNQILIEQFLNGDHSINIDSVVPLFHAGVYRIEEEDDAAVSLMCDRCVQTIRGIKNSYFIRWQYYDDKITCVLDEKEVVDDMVRALQNEEFFVVYQPIVDSESRQIVSAEALVRWQHPAKGVISPGVFIPVFEKNGFITELDRYTCEQVLKFLSARKKAGKHLVPISVNLSRTDFYNTNLSDEILALTRKYDIEASLLKIEITESIYENNQASLQKSVGSFREMGFRVLMDDFGSGYSSLNMLKDIMIDILKIDMRFMSELEESKRANNILYSVVQMAKSLDIEVVAEGVENQIQYQLVKNMGCECIQGYYFYRPLREELFAGLLDFETAKTQFSTHNRGMNIMLVCNQPDVVTAIRRALGSNYAYTERENGREALEYLKLHSNHIDMVFSMIDLPVMSGLELLEQMHTYRHMQDIPVVMLTDADKKKYISECIRLGAMDVVVTPFEPQIFKIYAENLLRVAGHSNIREEVEHLRDKLNLNQDIQSLADRQAIGLVRLVLADKEPGTDGFADVQIIRLVAATDAFVRTHGIREEHLRQAVRLEDCFVGPDEAPLTLLCDTICRMLRKRAEHKQFVYDIRYHETTERIMANIFIRYDEDYAILDYGELPIQ